MKNSLKLFSLLFVLFTLVACSNDDEETPTEFTVTAVNPVSGAVGTEITITGTGFPSEASQIDLSFNGVAASISSLSSTQIVTAVPAGAGSGEISISANGFTRAAPSSFTVLSNLVSETFTNLFAPQTGGFGEPAGGPFTKFSFADGDVTESETDWDIAFRSTTIAVNGGQVTGTNDEPARNGNAAAAIENGTFDDITSASGLTFVQDADGAFGIPTGSDSGWYNYNFMTNIVAPIPGKILVFRTADGKYAKVEILSYYEDAPANPDPDTNAARYFTFKYVYNPNEGETSLAE
ncbi:IPT/TIG domain-containing protein [Poritiphilus flavus]|uniref:IPT/TIG domain-containing protein n=1 Tax=Poritiphilus flavus TaxID=2697053 RepID=UPI001EEB6CDB|nr:IPT/TIG domain-containing protein [Poritiphilus flavus]